MKHCMGRGVRRDREQIRQLVTRYRQSGMTQREFAQAHGVALSTVHRWLRQQGDCGGATRSAARFVEVRLPAGGEANAPAVHVIGLPDGTRLEICSGFDPVEVEVLLGLLREQSQ